MMHEPVAVAKMKKGREEGDARRTVDEGLRCLRLAADVRRRLVMPASSCCCLRPPLVQVYIQPIQNPDQNSWEVQCSINPPTIPSPNHQILRSNLQLLSRKPTLGNHVAATQWLAPISRLLHTRTQSQ